MRHRTEVPAGNAYSSTARTSMLVLCAWCSQTARGVGCLAKAASSLPRAMAVCNGRARLHQPGISYWEELLSTMPTDGWSARARRYSRPAMVACHGKVGSCAIRDAWVAQPRSEEHTSELQSL